MSLYSAFGLTIESPIDLPELRAGEPGAKPDLEISRENIPMPPGAEPDSGDCVSASADSMHLYWPTCGSMLVIEGRRILIDAPEDVPDSTIRLFLLGSALSVALIQRGLAVFHASVIDVGGGAAAFMGDKGDGKSTTAAALHARGNALVADDNAAIDLTGDGALVLPGMPIQKLWPESLESVGDNPASHEKLHKDYEKRLRRLDHDFASDRVELKCIYLLGVGEAISIDTLPPAEAVKALLGHWYAGRFGHAALKAIGLATQFEQCMAVAQRVNVARLTRTNDLDALPQLAEAIEEHVRSL